MRQFDTVIKCQYNPYDRDCDMEYEIPMAGAPNIRKVNLKEGYLTLSKF